MDARARFDFDEKIFGRIRFNLISNFLTKLRDQKIKLRTKGLTVFNKIKCVMLFNSKLLLSHYQDKWNLVGNVNFSERRKNE